MMTQLDLKCAETGERLAQIRGNGEKRLEKLLNDALAVLQEQGLYACFLYLRAQGRSPGKGISDELYKFLSDVPGLNLKKSEGARGQDNMLSQVVKLAEDLDTLLFARELLLQVLTYARYHLKARSGGGT